MTKFIGYYFVLTNFILYIMNILFVLKNRLHEDKILLNTKSKNLSVLYDL